MDYMPLVTIIIPVYNGSNFLAEAIDAALAQTYKNIEVLVVNDGSKDAGASEKIALSYGDKVRYLRKENGGVSSALNYAFEKMTGEWFSWLSHDDLYYPEKIEKQIQFINELKNKNHDLDLNKITVRCATESIDKDGKVIKIPSYSDVPIEEEPINTIINNVYNYRLSGCAFLLPASCTKDIGGFREDIRTVSDVEYWYRLLFSGYRFYCMSNDRLVKNRSHGRQVGKTKVSLFDKELDDLHISIADQLAASEEFYSLEVMEKFYHGLVKRKIKTAAIYTKQTYLQGKMSAPRYYMLLPLIDLKWKVIGSFRNVARYVYRKINVK